MLIHKKGSKKQKTKPLSSKGASFQSVLKRTKANLSWRRGFPQTLPPYTQHLTKRLRKCWEVSVKGRWGAKRAAGMGVLVTRLTAHDPPPLGFLVPSSLGCLKSTSPSWSRACHHMKTTEKFIKEEKISLSSYQPHQINCFHSGGASFHPNLHSLIIDLLHFFLSFLTCVSLSKFQYLCWQSAMFSHLTSHE